MERKGQLVWSLDNAWLFQPVWWIQALFSRAMLLSIYFKAASLYCELHRLYSQRWGENFNNQIRLYASPWSKLISYKGLRYVLDTMPIYLFLSVSEWKTQRKLCGIWEFSEDATGSWFLLGRTSCWDCMINMHAFSGKGRLGKWLK